MLNHTIVKSKHRKRNILKLSIGVTIAGCQSNKKHLYGFVGILHERMLLPHF